MSLRKAFQDFDYDEPVLAGLSSKIFVIKVNDQTLLTTKIYAQNDKFTLKRINTLMPTNTSKKPDFENSNFSFVDLTGVSATLQINNEELEVFQLGQDRRYFDEISQYADFVFQSYTPSVRETSEDLIEYISIIFGQTKSNLKLICEYFNGSEIKKDIIARVEARKGQAAAYDCSVNTIRNLTGVDCLEYSIYLLDSEGKQVSDVKTFIVEPPNENAVSIQFKNSLGFWEIIHLSGTLQEKLSTEHEEILLSNIRKRFSTNVSRKFTIYFSALSIEWKLGILDLLHSQEVEINHPVLGWIKVLPDAQEIESFDSEKWLETLQITFSTIDIETYR